MPENVTVIVRENEMSDLPDKIASILTTRLIQVGTVAHENFTNLSKLIDYDYLEGHRLVGMTEAMGVREVSSKRVPAGPHSDTGIV